MSTPTVIAVTGPTGHDIGPAAAYLGRNLGDGLAVRIVPDAAHGLGGHAVPHASPVGFHAGHHVAPPGVPATVELECLPAAWQNPYTNLGVVYANTPDINGEPGDELNNDLYVMDQVGMDVRHRLTVQAAGLRYRAQVPPPVEVGDVVEIARDSVLRGAGEHRTVLIEAGDGLKLIDAFQALGLEPWSAHIGRLELWTVLDVAIVKAAGLAPADAAQVEVARQGGGSPTQMMFLALRNVQLLVPEVAGIGTDGFLGRVEQGDRVPDEAADRLGAIVADIESRSGARVGAVSTGPGPSGHEQWIDLDPT